MNKLLFLIKIAVIVATLFSCNRNINQIQYYEYATGNIDYWDKLVSEFGIQQTWTYSDIDENLVGIKINPSNESSYIFISQNKDNFILDKKNKRIFHDHTKTDTITKISESQFSLNDKVFECYIISSKSISKIDNFNIIGKTHIDKKDYKILKSTYQVFNRNNIQIAKWEKCLMPNRTRREIRTLVDKYK